MQLALVYFREIFLRSSCSFFFFDRSIEITYVESGGVYNNEKPPVGVNGPSDEADYELMDFLGDLEEQEEEPEEVFVDYDDVVLDDHAWASS